MTSDHLKEYLKAPPSRLLILGQLMVFIVICGTALWGAASWVRTRAELPAKVDTIAAEQTRLYREGSAALQGYIKQDEDKMEKVDQRLAALEKMVLEMRDMRAEERADVRYIRETLDGMRRKLDLHMERQAEP